MSISNQDFGKEKDLNIWLGKRNWRKK